MPNFQYRALDAQREVRSGRIQADNETEALRELLAQGLTPVQVQVEQASAATPAWRSKRIDDAQRMLLLQELGTLLAAGVTLGEALPSLAQSYVGTPLAQPLDEMERLVRGGEGLGAALALPSLAMPTYVLALAKAGEASGAMAAALQDAAVQLEHALRARRDLQTALVYPSILVLAGSAAVLFILVNVVPRFASLLRGKRAEDIPELSRWIIESGLFLQKHLLAFGLGLAGVAAVTALLLSRPAVRESLLRGLAQLPVIGTWLRQVDLGRWTTVLGSLLANRVPIVDALGLAQGVLRLPQLRQDLAGAAPALSRGRALAEVLAEFAWFPRARLNLVKVGERSGELPTMLRRLGDIETDAAQVMQKRVLALVEPIAILGIGAAIGFVMVGVMMAITTLNTSV